MRVAHATANSTCAKRGARLDVGRARRKSQPRNSSDGAKRRTQRDVIAPDADNEHVIWLEVIPNQQILT